MGSWANIKQVYVISSFKTLFNPFLEYLHVIMFAYIIIFHLWFACKLTRKFTTLLYNRISWQLTWSDRLVLECNNNTLAILRLLYAPISHNIITTDRRSGTNMISLQWHLSLGKKWTFSPRNWCDGSNKMSNIRNRVTFGDDWVRASPQLLVLSSAQGLQWLRTTKNRLGNGI